MELKENEGISNKTYTKTTIKLIWSGPSFQN